MKLLFLISLLLVTVGSINWGTIGLLDLNLVAKIFGDKTEITKIIYCLVGIAGVYVPVYLALNKTYNAVAN